MRLVLPLTRWTLLDRLGALAASIARRLDLGDQFCWKLARRGVVDPDSPSLADAAPAMSSGTATTILTTESVTACAGGVGMSSPAANAAAPVAAARAAASPASAPRNAAAHGWRVPGVRAEAN
mmetsp:Transcript_31177/g.72524  ORF Transcript_31177/g.72524 Transcript_31177/m.72524 type:complete len:123 (-) Transcript_31177:1076-1444(-)